MQVPSGPRRGPTFNNRWWNDRRSWNLRTTNGREKASPKGANHIWFCSCSPPSGTIKVCIDLSAASRVTKHNAANYAERLQGKGFKQARVLITENNVKVIYGTYNSESEAHAALKNLRDNEAFADGWITKVKE